MEAAPTPAVKAAHIPKAKAHHTSVAAFAAGTIAAKAATPAFAEAKQLLQQLQAIVPAVAPTVAPAAKAAPTPAKAARPVALSLEGDELVDRVRHQHRQRLCLLRMEICVNRLKLTMDETPSQWMRPLRDEAANLDLMFSIYADLEHNHQEYVGGKSE